MSLNIKNEEAHALARELAELRGVSLTEAVIGALRTEVARERNTEERLRQRVEAILAMGRVIASRMPEDWLTMDIDEYLYDENGLPR